eukprot:5604769-Prymnesium_polylepis.1
MQHLLAPALSRTYVILEYEPFMHLAPRARRAKARHLQRLSERRRAPVPPWSRPVFAQARANGAATSA